MTSMNLLLKGAAVAALLIGIAACEKKPEGEAAPTPDATTTEAPAADATATGETAPTGEMPADGTTTEAPADGTTTEAPADGTAPTPEGATPMFPAEPVSAEPFDALMKTFIDGLNAKDAAAIASVYADDAVYMAPGQAPITGKDAIAAALIANNFTAAAVDNDSVSVFGDFAYAEGKGFVTVTGADGASQTVALRYGMILSKTADGSWKIVRDMDTEAADLASAPFPTEAAGKTEVAQAFSATDTAEGAPSPFQWTVSDETVTSTKEDGTTVQMPVRNLSVSTLGADGQWKVWRSMTQPAGEAASAN